MAPKRDLTAARLRRMGADVMNIDKLKADKAHAERLANLAASASSRQAAPLPPGKGGAQPPKPAAPAAGAFPHLPSSSTNTCARSLSLSLFLHMCSHNHIPPPFFFGSCCLGFCFCLSQWLPQPQQRSKSTVPWMTLTLTKLQWRRVPLSLWLGRLMRATMCRYDCLCISHKHKDREGGLG